MDVHFNSMVIPQVEELLIRELRRRQPRVRPPSVRLQPRRVGRL